MRFALLSHLLWLFFFPRAMETPRRVAELIGKNQRCVDLAALTRNEVKVSKIVGILCHLALT